MVKNAWIVKLCVWGMIFGASSVLGYNKPLENMTVPELQERIAHLETKLNRLCTISFQRGRERLEPLHKTSDSEDKVGLIDYVQDLEDRIEILVEFLEQEEMKNQILY